MPSIISSSKKFHPVALDLQSKVNFTKLRITQKDEKQLKTVYFHYFQTWTSKNQLEACANSNVAGGNTFSGKEKGRRKKLDEFFLFDNFMIDE